MMTCTIDQPLDCLANIRLPYNFHNIRNLQIDKNVMGFVVAVKIDFVRKSPSTESTHADLFHQVRWT